MNDEALVLAAVRRATEGAAGDLAPDAVLQQLVDAALDLVGARYAALGVPDGDGGFSRFITAGMDDALIESLGPLPRTHGLLGAMLVRNPGADPGGGSEETPGAPPAPYRTDDIRRDPRFRGWWPPGHPDMRSFLGYPIVYRGGVVGAFYLTDKRDGPTFSERDERLVGRFTPHAAVLIELARLYDESRELSVVAERTRLARELHDSLTQTLFGTRLALRTATGALGPDPGTGTSGAAAPDPVAVAAAREQLDRAGSLLDTAFDELKALIWDLQPPDLETDGLAGAVGKQLALLDRTSDLRVSFTAEGVPRDLDPATEHQLLRIVQEATTNAARHSGAGALTVRITGSDGSRALRIEIRDDGRGFDPRAPAVRSRRLGMTSMHERAAAVGGQLHLASSPGAGTTVEVELPDA